ncbi:hypothetical protein [Undibacterium sp. GrIS 1.8]|uniref:hypothetical protein n=1 Tax=Undibacterium sp. GrIS 1.8 TaxID=3143934 RepID=UPI003394E605
MAKIIVIWPISTPVGTMRYPFCDFSIQSISMGRQRGTRESGSADRYGSKRHRNGTVLSITSLGAP